MTSRPIALSPFVAMRDRTPPPYDFGSNFVRLWNALVFWSFVACLVLFCRAFFAFGSLKLTAAPPNFNPLSSAFGNITNRFASKCEIPKFIPEQLLNVGLSQLGDCSEYTNFTIAIPLQHPADPAERNADSPFHTPPQVKETPLATPSVDNSPASPFFPYAGSADEIHLLPTADILPDRDYDPLEMEPFFSLEEFDDEGLNFALKVWLDKNDFYGAKLSQVALCQASSGVRCIVDD